MIELTLLGTSTVLLLAMWIALLTLAQVRQPTGWRDPGDGA